MRKGYNFNRLETIASVIELSGFKEIDIKWVQKYRYFIIK